MQITHNQNCLNIFHIIRIIDCVIYLRRHEFKTHEILVSRFSITFIDNSNYSQNTDGVTDGLRNTDRPTQTGKNLLLT